MGKKSNKKLRKENGTNYAVDDIVRLRQLYVLKEEVEKDDKRIKSKSKG